eukprot:6087253-Amphidinium_carterae.1
MDAALAEIRGKAGYVPMAVIPPTGPGAPVRVNIGPGPVAHVATAEQLIRRGHKTKASQATPQARLGPVYEDARDFAKGSFGEGFL